MLVVRAQVLYKELGIQHFEIGHGAGYLVDYLPPVEKLMAHNCVQTGYL
jgi:hypothetical protein